MGELLLEIGSFALRIILYLKK